jgi:hypothetical protein
MPQITRQVQIWPLRDNAAIVVFADFRESRGHAAISRRLLRRESARYEYRRNENEKRRANESPHRYGCTSKLNIIA